MPLILSDPPTAAKVAFASGLPAFLFGPGGLENAIFAGIPPEIPTLSEIGTTILEAQEVFVLTLQDAANNTGTLPAKPAGWRFFAGPPTPGETVVAATAGAKGRTKAKPKISATKPAPLRVVGKVIQQQPSQAWKLASVHYGPLVQQDLNNSLALAALPQVQAADYVVCVLDVPGVNARAFWLKAQTVGSADLFVSIPPGSNRPVPGPEGPAPAPQQDFLATIVLQAQNNLNIGSGRGAA
jgi:hypothetical protein